MECRCGVAGLRHASPRLREIFPHPALRHRWPSLQATGYSKQSMSSAQIQREKILVNENVIYF